MKFPYAVTCSCGEILTFEMKGSAQAPDLVCRTCRSPAHLIDPITLSLVGDRLLFRARTELAGGDASLCILFGAIAIESFLSALYLKMERLDAGIIGLPPEKLLNEWQESFEALRTFKKKANKVSELATQHNFDDFFQSDLECSNFALPHAGSALNYVQTCVMDRRNRILHQGQVDFSDEVAHECEVASRSAVAIIRRMNEVRFANYVFKPKGTI